MALENKHRLDSIDCLRGFAIMGIMLVHSIGHFNFYMFPAPETQAAWLTALDPYVWDTLFFLFAGRAYSIFAILFGFTFFLMVEKQHKAGEDFGYRFLWRMLLLAGFAFINGMFFPGEVLLMYSIIAVVLFAVRHFETRSLLIVSVLLLSQPLEWTRYTYYLFNNDYAALALNTDELWNKLAQGQKGGSLWNLIVNNTLYGHKVSLLWSYEVGRIAQSAGLFVLGYWLGKKQFFYDTPEHTKLWLRTLVTSILLFIPLYWLEKNLGTYFELPLHKATLLVMVDMYGNLAFTLILLSSFLLLFKTRLFSKMVSGLKYCGRMSLTAYFMQYLLGSFVFYGYGLGLGIETRPTVSLGIGVVLFILQYYLCKFWILKYQQGPLEILWHKLTWVKSPTSLIQITEK